MTYAEADAPLLALMGEPRLSRDNLLTVARTLYRSASSGVAHNVRLAVCKHRLADTEVIATALWTATQATIRAVGVATGTLRTRCDLVGAPPGTVPSIQQQRTTPADR